MLAILPVVIFMIVIYRRDRIREPWQILLKCMLGGVLSVLVSLLISVPLTHFSHLVNGPAAKAFYTAFMLAAIPEEFAKMLMLFLFVWKSREFDQRFDGIVYAVFISLGFALVENIMYVAEGGVTVAIGRALLAVPGHGFFGVLMGYFFSKAKFTPHKKQIYLFRAFFYPVLFHGLYDFFLMWNSHLGEDNIALSLLLSIAFLILVVLLWHVGLRAIRKHVISDFANGIRWQ
jgi:RsiW-degrading membrane proteinase PrsW (M82 family)